MKIIVIGAGAAGLMAAISASQEHEVLVIEKKNKIGTKLLMTGNGRCNVLNNKTSDNFIRQCSKSSRFMYSALCQKSPRDLIGFFTSHNCPLKEEDDNRMFPQSDKAQSILNVLLQVCRDQQVKFLLDSPVTDVILKENRLVGVKCDDKIITGDHFIFACGGMSFPNTGSDGDGYRLASKCHHSITDLMGVEVGLVSQDTVIETKELMGLSLRNVEVSVYCNDKKKMSTQGDVMFTHFGLSGPAVLTVSEVASQELKKGHRVEISIKTCDNLKLEEGLLSKKLKELGPKRWINYLVKEQNRMIDQMSKKEVHDIEESFRDCRITVTRPLPIQRAFVSAGGVKTSELDPKTMRSKLIENLSLCGEMIDVHGPVGGYNLTLAFVSGWCAGKGVYENSKN